MSYWLCPRWTIEANTQPPGTDGVMEWSLGARSTHAGHLYAIPDTMRPPLYSLNG
jgi:hypothetical protein